MSWLCWVSHRNILPHTHTIHCPSHPLLLGGGNGPCYFRHVIYMYVDHDAKPPKEFFVEINNAYCIQGYFCPVVWWVFFSPFYTCTFLPHFDFTHIQMCDRYTVIWKLFLIHPVVDSPSDNMGKRVKNKTGANISLYTVYCVNDKSIFCTNFCFSF